MAVIWSIWKCRNKFIFQGKKDSIRQVAWAATRLADDISKIPGHRGATKRKIPVTVSWIKPGSGWHKLNTDGSVRSNIRRDWIAGFSSKLGDVTITQAELLAAREGLRLAWERRIQRIEIELDSEVVLKMINEADTAIHPLGRIIEDCRSLLRKPWESRLIHTRRSGNACADALAKMGHDLENELCVWESIPEEITYLVREDKS
ncbi:hypothetical protein ACJIZ3_004002 [Penstemon smallii]|uniref:RNase H type-1 domain-containing protein n=1 Tax=Penstemon smallii TaxID=265156 RepID=A0ABD3S0V1_9LAMI